MSDPARLIEMAAERFARKVSLPKNVAKGSWVRMDDEAVASRLLDELAELLVAIHKADGWDAIVDEAADVFAFALMGADPVRQATVYGREAER